MHNDSGDSSEDELSSNSGDSSEDESSSNSPLIDGHLRLGKDPMVWIRKNPTLLLSVRHLDLNYSGRGGKGIIADSIGELTELTHLSIEDVKTITCLPNILSTLPNLQMLHLEKCDKIQELPPNLGDLESLTSLSVSFCHSLKALPDSLANLSKLTNLDISFCNGLEELPANFGELESLMQFTLTCCNSIKSLPDSFAKLSKLTKLNISGCVNLEELPANFGELESLTHFKLENCSSIKSLPSSVVKLSKLTALNFEGCNDLEELPANFGEFKSLTHFTLHGCSSIKSLPDSVAKLSKLTTLNIHSCDNLLDLPANLGELKSLTHLCNEKCRSLNECPSNLNVVDLSLIDCCSIQSLPRGLSNLDRLNLSLCSNTGEERLANLKYFASLCHLKFQDCSLCKSYVKELPVDFYKLSQLSLLDIHETRIKCLPSSIMKLSKLRLLLLPSRFILETLPYQLHESLVISVEDSHVRKTWKELKKEMEIFSSPTVRVDPSGYLPLTGDPTPWIHNNHTSHSMVRILDLDLEHGSAENITDSITNLTELTHLHITDGILTRLPLELTRVLHLSLYDCVFHFGMESSLHSLRKLSTLESLHISLCDTELLDQMDLPVSLRQLTLCLGNHPVLHPDNMTPCLGKHPAPLPASMTKLSNLKALNLFGKGIQFDLLPEILNLEKLKLVDCYMKSLPRGRRHMEILHTKRMCLHKCDGLGICFDQLADVDTLSITCHGIKFLPSIAGLHSLQELQLKDCFNFKELPPDLDVMVNLCTLNVSGTRIKSLPCSISNLPKLQCLILPQCFPRENLPLEFRNQSIIVSIDGTDDKYYKDMGYYDVVHETCGEVDNDTKKTIERVNKVVSKESEVSPHQLLNQSDVTPVIGGSHGSEANHPLGKNSHRTFFSLQNQDTEMLSSESEQLTADNRHLNLHEPCFPSSQHALQHEHMASMTSEIKHGLPPTFQHDFSRGTGNNLLVSDYGQNEDNKHGEEYSPNFQEKIHFGGSSQHDLQNIQMPENKTWFNQEVLKESEVGIIKEQQTSPQQMLNLLDALPDSNSNSRNDLVGKNSHHAISRSEICEKRITGFDFQETGSFRRNSQHAVHNGQMDVINSETEHEIRFLNQEISSRNERDVSRSGDNLNTLENQQFDINSQNEGEKSQKHRRGITLEGISELAATQMRLIDAAHKLGVSRSTLKRKLKDFGMKWPSSRKRKRNTCTELPFSIKSFSQVNMVPVDHEHTMEGLDGADRHILSDQVSYQHCNVIDNSTIDATEETVKAPGETQLHTDDHGANPSSLSKAVQKSESSCSFVVKATYKEDTVKFDSFATTIVEIKEQVADYLELESGKFKIKYEDSDKELLLMTKNEHLEEARNLSDSSGSKFLRLFIFDL